MKVADSRWANQLSIERREIFEQAQQAITNMRRSRKADFQFFLAKPRNTERTEVIGRVRRIRGVTDTEFAKWAARYENTYGSRAA